MITVNSILSGFEPISLAEMESVALMNRIDKKYLIPRNEALSILQELQGAYYSLQIVDQRFFKYRTVYFDTENHRFLYDHLRGKMNRLKVRTRQYVSSSAQFFEIKRKTNKGKTVKSRIPTDQMLNCIGNAEAEFLNSKTSMDHSALIPHVEVDFYRTTLVSLLHKERITFDFNLSFYSGSNKKQTDDFVIIEHKRASNVSGRTPALEVLKRYHYHPTSLSKYVLGMILMGRADKYNTYKPKLRQLNKISEHGNIW